MSNIHKEHIELTHGNTGALTGADIPYDASDDLNTKIDSKEDSFSKNTGFNKNLGVIAGTVSEGDHDHDTEYEPLGSGGSYTLLDTKSPSGSSLVDSFTGIDDTYDEYRFEFNITTSVTNEELQAVISDDNGSTYKTGAADYSWEIDQGGNTNQASSDSSITLAENLTTTDAPLRGFVDLLRNKTTGYSQFRVDASGPQAANIYHGSNLSGGGAYKGAKVDIDDVRFLMSSGTITGTIKLYGVNRG